MKRGRKRKPGKREPNGRIARAAIDRGTDRVQAMQAIYGTDGCDAIGRAYRSGLLGTGQDAKATLDTARRISKAYWAAYGIGGAFCTLGERTGSGSSDGHKAREDWLEDCLRVANWFGRTHRSHFDALVIDINPDSGPAWLDRLCLRARANGDPRPSDLTALACALEVLQHLAGVGERLAA